jgi:hypothetical protein
MDSAPATPLSTLTDSGSPTLPAVKSHKTVAQSASFADIAQTLIQHVKEDEDELEDENEDKDIVGHTKWPALDSEDQDITLSQITSHLWSNYPSSDYFCAPKN